MRKENVLPVDKPNAKKVVNILIVDMIIIDFIHAFWYLFKNNLLMSMVQEYDQSMKVSKCDGQLH